MKTQVVKDCCAKSYLDMMRLQAEQSENWTFRFPMNKEKYIPIEEHFSYQRLHGVEYQSKIQVEKITYTLTMSLVVG